MVQLLGMNHFLIIQLDFGPPTEPGGKGVSWRLVESFPHKIHIERW